MAALQPLAVAMPLSARLRLALHPHAASECITAGWQRNSQEKTPRGDSRGFFISGVGLLSLAHPKRGCPGGPDGDLL